ncbi:DUF4258 domain-containing protein [Longitalea arenae]|uniref:DUF4258 domain-containing protein n=1 Tax=Longitalea arenae TaxID=2812558 RepID=UPI001967C52E|nr:DUF4258 domain-containing protein [Longitalea arenae]
MKQILSYLAVFCTVLLMACQGANTSSEEPRKQHKERRHKQYHQPDRDNRENAGNDAENGAMRGPESGPAGSDLIDRHPDRLIYTKHARCRMQCRHIDEAEVKEILAEGRINYRKSEPAGRPDPKYALEGTTRDGQDVRIIFAPSKRGMVVITVIDLETEWSCDCK